MALCPPNPLNLPDGPRSTQELNDRHAIVILSLPMTEASRLIMGML